MTLIRWENKRSRSFFIKAYSGLVLVLLVVAASACQAAGKTDLPRIEAGRLDLAAQTLQQEGKILLDGPWAFYWDRFVSPAELPKEVPDLYMVVPGPWNRGTLSGSALPGTGLATYHLLVHTDLPPGTPLGLYVHTASSAYSLFVDSRLVGNSGKPTALAAAEQGQYMPRAYSFTVPAPTFSLVFQVSNHQHARGGLWESLVLGTPEAITSYYDLRVANAAFLSGALLITGLFFLTLYLIRREHLYALFFALFCLSALLPQDMAGQFLLTRILPQLPLQAGLVIWYSSVMWALFFLSQYISTLFPSRLSVLFIRVLWVMVIWLQLFFLLAPVLLFTSFTLLFNVLGTLCILGIIAMISKGIRQKKTGGWLSLFSVLIILAAFLHATLVVNNVVRARFTLATHIGIYSFILLHMVLQSLRIRHHDEKRVNAEMHMLQAQIKPHFLYNAINTFISISRYDMEKARNLLLDFSHYLRYRFDFRSTSQLVPLNQEIELAKAYVAIEKARHEDRIDIYFSIETSAEARVPLLSLQPVIENAINHGLLSCPEGGQVGVHVRQDGRMLHFRVDDNGVGMDCCQLGQITCSGAKKGIGLPNLDSRLKNLYGRGLQIDSAPGEGTRVSWQVPLKG